MIRMLGSPKGRRGLALAAIAVLTSALSVTLSSGAHAATATAQVQGATVIRMTQPMKVVGFDAAIAKAHGYTVHTNAKGQPYVTKAGAAAAAPNDVVEGECGDSWVDYTAIGKDGSKADPYTAVLSSGYTLNAPVYGVALEGYWVIAVADAAGTGYVEDDTPIANGVSWSASWDTDHSVTGYSLATVMVSSYVYTDEGWVCNSGGPYASTTLRS